MLNYESFEHPKNSSDCALAVTTPDGRSGAFCVLDTIGSPRNRKIGRVPDRLRKRLEAALQSADDFEARRRAVTEALTATNAELVEMNNGREPIFGFCTCAALMQGNRSALYSAGDCRTYRFFRETDEETDETITRVQCLTRDDNALNTMVARERETTLFKNELLELSRRLSMHLGVPDFELFAKRLTERTQTRTLAEDEAWLLTTDGWYLPLLREQLELTFYKVDYGMLYLEAFLEQRLREREATARATGPAVWRETMAELQDEARSFSQRKQRYSDDMATLWIDHNGKSA